MATRHGRPDEVRLPRPDSTVRPAQLGVRRPAPVVAVSGTTADFDPALATRLLPMLASAVAVASEHRAAIVTGGTDAGVFHLLGLALSSAARRPRVVIGVAPDDLVEPMQDPHDEKRAHVDPQLSVLVRVPGSSWGDETAILSDIVGSISSRRPAVMLLAGGGDVSRSELVEHLARGRPVVIIAGTGRLADDVAQGRVGTVHDQEPAKPAKVDDLGALLASGDVRIVSLDDGPRRMHTVLASLLAPARRRTLRQRFALLSALPQWRFRPDPPDPPLDPVAARRYPLLRKQITDADRIIYPAFAECDLAAQVEQNRYRWFTVLAIAGGVLTTAFAALQAWLQTAPWPGVVVATLGAATSTLTTVARRQGSLQNYLTARIRAERLRSLYFEHLASAPATDATARRRLLRDLERRVIADQSKPVAP